MIGTCRRAPTTSSLLTVPHPEVDLTEFQDAPRAPTLEGGENPYQLPLSAKELKQLESSLRGFTVHQLIGMLCAVVSAPRPVRPMAWMPAVAFTLRHCTKAEAQALTSLFMQVHNSVLDRMVEGLVAELIPEAEDVEACRMWARGYALISVQSGMPERLEADGGSTALRAIHLLTEQPKYVATFENEVGDVGFDDLDICRDRLVHAASYLYTNGEWQRAKEAAFASPAAEPTLVGPKVGRNDPCTCGSGKKLKKCCG